jgi:glycosyltransferase involved in cell wall biosynthesis
LAGIPLVSIIVIAYNEEKYLSAAIESAISQDYPHKEIIVVNDGSTDKTLAVAELYSNAIKIISQKNSGGCSSPRNTGLSVAKGKYIAFLDGDDLFFINKISTQVEALEQNPKAVCVINNYKNFNGEVCSLDHFSSCENLTRMFKESNSEKICFEKGHAAQLLIQENFSIASSPLFRLNVVRQMNGFNESLFACEDFHLIYRIAMNNSVLVDKNVLFLRRMNENNMSSNTLKMGKFYVLSRLDLYKQEVDEKRKKLLKLRILNYLGSHFKVSIKSLRLADSYKAILIAFYLFLSD